MVRPHPTPHRLLLRRRLRRARLLRAACRQPHPGRQYDATTRAREGARDRPQHPVRAVLDAVPCIAGVVDRKAYASDVWCAPCFAMKTTDG